MLRSILHSTFSPLIKSSNFWKSVPKYQLIIDRFASNYPQELKEFNSENPNFFQVILDLEKKNEVDASIKKLENSKSGLELFLLSSLYKEGFYVQKDLKKSREYLEKAMQTNGKFPFDLVNELFFQTDKKIALTYLENSGIKNKEYYQGVIHFNDGDYEKSIHYFKIFLLYKKESKDYFKVALDYLEKMEKLGVQNATNELGLIYFYSNPDKAKFYLEKSLDLKIKYYLGRIYFGHENSPINFEESFKNFEISYQNGFIGSAIYLGVFYYFGLNPVQKDVKKAFEYFQKVPYHKISSHYLGIYYLYELEVIQKDLKKSLELFECALKKGNLDSAPYIGRIYYLNKNYQKSMEYHNINPNSPISNFDKGKMFFSGLGVKKDIQKAIILMKKSANYGNKFAKHFLGKLYLNGEGVKKDEKKAIDLYLNDSSTDSNDILARHFWYKKDYVKALKYLKENKNDKSTYSKIAKIYMEGLGVEKDLNLAKQYLEIGAKKDEKKSQDLLKILNKSLE